jgi:hypothetical protein
MPGRKHVDLLDSAYLAGDLSEFYALAEKLILLALGACGA